MKTGVLLIGMCVSVYVLLRTTVTWSMTNDGGADFVRVPRDVSMTDHRMLLLLLAAAVYMVGASDDVDVNIRKHL